MFFTRYSSLYFCEPLVKILVRLDTVKLRDRKQKVKKPLLDIADYLRWFSSYFVAISWESFGSLTSATTLLTAQACDRDRNNYNGLDFKIIIDSKSGPPTTLTLVASTHQEKIAWCSDISQVNIQF